MTRLWWAPFWFILARRSHPQCQLCTVPHWTAGDGGCQTVCGIGANGSPGQQCRRTAAAADADADADGEIPFRWYWVRFQHHIQWHHHHHHYQLGTQRVRRVQHAGNTTGRRTQWGESVCRQQSQSGLANDTHCSLAGLVHRRRFVRGENTQPKNTKIIALKWGKHHE